MMHFDGVFMEIEKYWVNIIRHDLINDVPEGEQYEFNLIQAGYLILGLNPRDVRSVKSPQEVIHLVGEMSHHVVKETPDLAGLHPSKIFVSAFFIQTWAQHLGVIDFLNIDGVVANELPESNPHMSNELQIALDAFSGIFGNTKIDKKYEGSTYKQAIELWMKENRPAVKSNSESAYNRIIGILNPDKKGNKIDASFFEE